MSQLFRTLLPTDYQEKYFNKWKKLRTNKSIVQSSNQLEIFIDDLEYEEKLKNYVYVCLYSIIATKENLFTKKCEFLLHYFTNGYDNIYAYENVGHSCYKNIPHPYSYPIKNFHLNYLSKETEEKNYVPPTYICCWRNKENARWEGRIMIRHVEISTNYIRCCLELYSHMISECNRENQSNFYKLPFSLIKKIADHAERVCDDVMEREFIKGIENLANIKDVKEFMDNYPLSHESYYDGEEVKFDDFQGIKFSQLLNQISNFNISGSSLQDLLIDVPEDNFHVAKYATNVRLEKVTNGEYMIDAINQHTYQKPNLKQNNNGSTKHKNIYDATEIQKYLTADVNSTKVLEYKFTCSNSVLHYSPLKSEPVCILGGKNLFYNYSHNQIVAICAMMSDICIKKICEYFDNLVLKIETSLRDNIYRNSDDAEKITEKQIYLMKLSMLDLLLETA